MASKHFGDGGINNVLFFCSLLPNGDANQLLVFFKNFII
jgi:hypothetical protein